MKKLFDGFGQEVGWLWDGGGNDNSGCAVLVYLAIALYVVYAVLAAVVSAVASAVESVRGAILNYHTFEQPYRAAAGFYYYALAVPLDAVWGAAGWFVNTPFVGTPYPNLNLILSVALKLLLVAGSCVGVVALVRRVSWLGRLTEREVAVPLALRAAGLYLAPLAFIGLWALGVVVFGRLFAGAAGAWGWLFAR